MLNTIMAWYGWANLLFWFTLTALVVASRRARKRRKRRDNAAVGR